MGVEYPLSAVKVFKACLPFETPKLKFLPRPFHALSRSEEVKLYLLSSKLTRNSPVLRKKAEAHFRKGESLLPSAQFGPAKDFFEIALKAHWESGDHSGTARCLLKLGRVLELTGHYTKAHTAMQESAMLFLLLNDKNGIARCKASLGSVGWATGRYE